jgi:prophage tail gpP-like protein
MQCVVANEMLASIYNAIGQASNAEELNAAAAAKLEAEVASESYKGYKKFIQTVLEHPAMSPAEVVNRVNYERLFRDGTQITAHVTVQGWLRDGKALWRCGDDVGVHAPMAMLDFVMKIQTLTFTQDNQSGTTTVLELVMPWKLSDKPFGALDNPAGPPLQPGTSAPTLPPELIPPG